MTNPYPYRQEGVELTHWSVTKAACYLANFSYTPSSFNVAPLPASVVELEKLLMRSAMQGAIPSFRYHQVYYLKPWDAAQIAIEKWKPAQDPFFRERCQSFQSWPILALEELYRRPSWSLEEACNVIWGRKLLGPLKDPLWVPFGPDEWEQQESNVRIDLDEVQRPLFQAIDADFPHLINFDAGTKKDRFQRSTILQWCCRKGIPLLHVKVERNDLKVRKGKNLNSQSPPIEEITSGTFRADGKFLLLTVFFIGGEVHTAKFKRDTKQGKLVIGLCSAGKKGMSGADIIKHIYAKEFDDGVEAKRIYQRFYTKMFEVREILEQKGIPMDVLSKPANGEKILQQSFSLHIPNLKLES